VDSHFHLDLLMEYAAMGNMSEALKLGEVEPNRDLKVIAAVVTKRIYLYFDIYVII